MTDTATPETGPVDAPASIDSIVAELEAGNTEGPADDIEAVTQELVNEAEGKGDAEEAPATEDDATEATTEAEEAEEGAPEEQDEPKFTVKVNGQDIEVPQSELLKGYSRTEDYKAKTMALADDRRALDTEKSGYEGKIAADYANKLEEATNLFAQLDPVLSEARNLDWERLKTENPAAFVQAQEAVQQRLNVLQNARGEVERIKAQTAQQSQQAMQAERAQRFDQAADKIVKAMPELADQAKFQSFASDAIGYLREGGFSAEEIADAVDDRVLLLADKARRWEAHEKAQAKLPEKRVVTKSAVKPLTTDGASSSRAPSNRFPGGRATRETRLDWIANAILESQEA